MTHAFFKALLFMGAGSVIGAMAGIQDMDRMGGFRRAMPFTFVTFTIGALTLSGFPFTAGFFSKDEILAFAINRGGFYVVLAVFGYVGAFLTAFYAFRMVFRVFFGEPVAEARELEAGHLAHGDPVNPMTGEAEDTDVGFPGPEHHVAERVLADEGRDGAARAALDRGRRRVDPGRDRHRSRSSSSRRSRTRASTTPRPPTAPSGSAWRWAALISIIGIGLAWWVYIRAAGHTPRAVRALRAGARLPRATSGTSTSCTTAMFVRPIATIGGFGRRVIETDFVQGMIVGGATGVVRVGSSFARASPDRLPARIRAAAPARRGGPDPLLPDQQLVTIHLSIVLFLPLACGLVSALLPPRLGALGRARRPASWCSAYVIVDARRLRVGRRAPVRHGRRVDLRARHPLQARASTG